MAARNMRLVFVLMAITNETLVLGVECKIFIC
jgi:hypothetical protein